MLFLISVVLVPLLTVTILNIIQGPADIIFIVAGFIIFLFLAVWTCVPFLIAWLNNDKKDKTKQIVTTLIIQYIIFLLLMLKSESLLLYSVIYLIYTFIFYSLLNYLKSKTLNKK